MMAAIYTCSATSVPLLLSEYEAENIYVISVIANVPKGVFDAVNGHQQIAAHEIITIDDGADMPPLLYTAITHSIEAIQDHLGEGGIVLIHCRKGISRSTTAHGMLLHRMNVDMPLVNIGEAVESGRWMKSSWNPVDAAKEWFKEKEYERAGDASTFAFGETLSQQASYIRLKRRQRAREE